MAAQYNTALSMFATGYSNANFVADLAAPIVIVSSPAGEFTQFNRRDALTPLDAEMAENGEARELGVSTSTGTFKVVHQADKSVIARSTIAAAEKSGFPIRPFKKATERVVDNLLLLREIRIATIYTTDSQYASSAYYPTAGNYWSDTGLGTPLADAHSAIGVLPNGNDGSELIAIASLPVRQALQRHPDFTGNNASATMEEVANLMGVSRIVAADARKQTANPGQTAVYSYVWGSTDFFIIRVPKGEFIEGDEIQAFAATMRFPVNTRDAATAMEVRTYSDEKRGRGGSEVVQCEHSDADVRVMNDQAVRIKGALA